MDYSHFAHLYDSFVGFEDDLPFFVEECRGSSGPVLELMAGTGRVSAALVESGVVPVCVDASRAMLSILGRKLGERLAGIVCADARALPFAGRFEVAILPFNSFSELVSENDRRAALRAIHGALAPRARFVCTLHNPRVRLRSVGPAPQVVARFDHPERSGEVTLTIESRYDRERGVVEGVQVFTTRTGDEVVRELRVPLEFCLPTASWFAEAAGSSGFIVEALYGDYDRSEYDEASSRFMIWRLRKGAP